jgi:putative hemolysin
VPYWYIILILISLGFSAFFSSAESAFLALQNTPRLQHLVSSGDSKALRIQQMLSSPERLLATILLGNNLVNILFASLVTMLVMDFIKDELVGVIVATVLGTAVLLIFGEVIPKAFAVRNSEKVAFVYARPLKIVEIAFYPIIVSIQFVSRTILVRQIEDTGDPPSITEGELRTLIDIGEAEGAFDPEEAELLENVFRFGDRQAREVMTPRTEIVFVEQESTLQDFLKVYAENSHTRFPVFQDETENVTGIISSKDILQSISGNGVNMEKVITKELRPAYFFPETKRISELFQDMRMSGSQIAIIVDEFGGVAGLVTLKKLLTELAGPVGEEGEAPEEEYEAIDEFTFQVDGSMDIDEAQEAFAIDLPHGDFETVAGFVLDHLGHIPVVGEQFEFNQVKVEVLEMRKFKVESIRLIKPFSSKGKLTETN